MLLTLWSRHPINKPKPNTRFLRNLVRDTDSHNAALLAKEAAESKLRLDQLVNKDVRTEKDIRRRQLGNISAILGANASRTRRVESSQKKENEHTGASSLKTEYGDQPRDHIEGQRRRRTGNEDEDDGAGGHRRRRSRCREAQHSRTNSEHDSRSSHRMRSLSPRDQKLTDTKRRDRSPHRQSHSKHEDKDVGHRRGPHYGSRRSQHHSDAKSSESRPRENSSSRRPRDRVQQDPHHRSRPERTPPIDDDSDPLEAIVGPLPPPKIKARGRGTVSAGSGIDGRFSDTYDPSLDLTTGDAGDGDDWDMVLDRVKWRQQGAERLRAAGFTEQEVQGWETGKKPEFRWAKNGEGREWDRGKTDLA